MDKRRFHRVKCSAPGGLIHNEMEYKCRLENVSLRGALISANECIMVPLGESCLFSVSLEPGTSPLLVTVNIVHCFFSMVGVKFVAFSGDAESRLFDFLKRTTTEPVKLMEEWETIVERREALQEESLSRSVATAS